jgi:hypothetical protein
MKNLPEARVARLAECHKKQKAGYGHHASPTLNSNITIPLNPSQHLERKYASFPMHSANFQANASFTLAFITS